MRIRNNLVHLMPWIVAVLGIILVFIVGGQTFYRVGYREADLRYGTEMARLSSSENQLRQCLALSGAGEVEACLAAVPSPDRAEERAEEASATQREIADWAGRTLWATLAGTLVTTGGVVLVAFTLVESRKAAIAAMDAAKHARRQADTSEETLRILEGAQLYPEIISDEGLYHHAGVSMRSLDYTIVNADRSVAVLKTLRHYLGPRRGELDTLQFVYEIIEPGKRSKIERRVFWTECEQGSLWAAGGAVFSLHLVYSDAVKHNAIVSWTLVKPERGQPFHPIA